MFGLDLELRDKFNEANIQHAATYGAILELLIEKGVFTDDEYQRTRSLALHAMEQEFAQKRDNAQKKNP